MHPLFYSQIISISVFLISFAWNRDVILSTNVVICAPSNCWKLFFVALTFSWFFHTRPKILIYFGLKKCEFFYYILHFLSILPKNDIETIRKREEISRTAYKLFGFILKFGCKIHILPFEWDPHRCLLKSMC